MSNDNRWIIIVESKLTLIVFTTLERPDCQKTNISFGRYINRKLMLPKSKTSKVFTCYDSSEINWALRLPYLAPLNVQNYKIDERFTHKQFTCVLYFHTHIQKAISS